jgi:hypothetical protein
MNCVKYINIEFFPKTILVSIIGKIWPYLELHSIPPGSAPVTKLSGWLRHWFHFHCSYLWLPIRYCLSILLISPQLSAFDNIEQLTRSVGMNILALFTDTEASERWIIVLAYNMLKQLFTAQCRCCTYHNKNDQKTTNIFLKQFVFQPSCVNAQF